MSVHKHGDVTELTIDTEPLGQTSLILRPSANGLEITFPDILAGWSGRLGLEEIDALIRAAGIAWEASGGE